MQLSCVSAERANEQLGFLATAYEGLWAVGCGGGARQARFHWLAVGTWAWATGHTLGAAKGEINQFKIRKTWAWRYGTPILKIAFKDKDNSGSKMFLNFQKS